jgi:Asp-tRNA(Asn)/Glu-tRNA(Gln) amidotransferase A subunit family amidase
MSLSDPETIENSVNESRRCVLGVLAGLGIGSTVLHRAIAAQTRQGATITIETIKQAEWIAGLELSDEERATTAATVARAVHGYDELRQVALDNSVPPAIAFDPTPGQRPSPQGERGTVKLSESNAAPKPKTEEDLAFLPVTELAALVRSRQVTSLELTKLYLARLKRFDPLLKCVVTLTEELAIQQAKRADREIAAGQYRGPLHGIPWGAKDLISHPGYPTTWGAKPFEKQTIDTKATVAQRLEDAGAVLVAKLTLGALAMGDKWFGGMTRNPWNPKEGSSGSSAGPASATAAGLVGFSIGSETRGSIVSPSRRCGTTGLRPTFGRVSRHGCMTLSWSMDKLGPITRSVEDCALVFGAIHGHDGLDPSAVDRPFDWPGRRNLSTLRIGYFENGTPIDQRADLKTLRDLGVKLKPIELPSDPPAGPVGVILTTEAAAVFDELTRKGITEGLNSWPRIFRAAQFVPAVEYLRANRVRTLLMRKMAELFHDIDAYVNGDDLGLTNLTGHPTVILPDGLTQRGGVEVTTSITFTGQLNDETNLLSLAHAYQQATGHHLRRPPVEKWLQAEGEK